MFCHTPRRAGKRLSICHNGSGRTAQEWQELLTYDILAINADGLWVHQIR
ncbi:MAG: hypothetical protein ACLS4A_12790 [Oscillospiraceae bacterium]